MMENATADNEMETESEISDTSVVTTKDAEKLTTEPEEDTETGHHSLPEFAEDLRVNAGSSSSSSVGVLEVMRCLLQSLHQRNVLLPAALGVVVLILVVSLSVGLSNGSTSSATSERMTASVQFLSLVSNPIALQRSTGAQHLAADWISNQDILQYPVPSSLEDVNATLFVQRYALAVLHLALGGNGWLINTHFLSKHNECEWFQSFKTQDGEFPLGVTCDDNGRVSELRLPGNNLHGQIPPEIGLLTDLHHLTLYGNSINGALPKEMASLTGIDFLSLGSNAISGTIPVWFGGLQKLHALDMGDNKLTGVIPPAITKLTSLVDLALDTNSLVGEVTVLNDMAKLKRLFLAENLFEGPVDNLFTTLGLKELDMSDNNLVGSLPLHLFSLKVLDLSRNELTGPIPEFPERDDKLEYLSLYDNQLSGEIHQSIWNLTGLRHLDLSDNKFSGYMPGFAFAWMYNLTYLFMANNPFKPEVIPKFWDMKSLRELSLKNTKRTGTIPHWMGSKLTNLVLLDLGDNELEGTLPESLGKLDKLTFLILNGNNLNGTVPASFDRMANICKLQRDSEGYCYRQLLISLCACVSLQPCFYCTIIT
jgi:Leucine-rich repeat (LRR) protein